MEDVHARIDQVFELLHSLKDDAEKHHASVMAELPGPYAARLKRKAQDAEQRVQTIQELRRRDQESFREQLSLKRGGQGELLELHRKLLDAQRRVVDARREAIELLGQQPAITQRLLEESPRIRKQLKIALHPDKYESTMSAESRRVAETIFKQVNT